MGKRASWQRAGTGMTVMTETRGAGGVAVLPSERTESTGRVLVIEDEEGISAYLAMVLDLGGYDVVCCESALGLATLLRSWRPDVVLLDLGLPYRSGATVLADLKTDPATATIPVVVFTG